MVDLKKINMKYIALVLLETENMVTKIKSYDETILSIEASSEDEARKLAEKYGLSCEGSYKNGFGDEISIKFLKVIDVNSHLREEYEEGIKELYSRHFTDLNSYQKFEILSK